jgi:microcystin-dependent protein
VATPYLSEIRIMSFVFPPKGWALCNGQTLSISQNQALFSLLGNMYGGDGSRTFALPNLQGRVPVHRAPGFTQGQLGGEQAHTLTVGEEPVHTHAAMGTSTAGDAPIPAGNYLGAANNMYAPLANTTPISPTTIMNAGGSQPHQNMQPYTVLSFCIALQGVYPTPN